MLEEFSSLYISSAQIAWSEVVSFWDLYQGTINHFPKVVSKCKIWLQENSTNCCVSNYDPPQQSLSSEHQDAGSMSGRIQWITNGDNEKLQSKPETKMSSDELLGYSGKEFTIQEALKNVSFWVALLVLSYNEYLLIIISTYYKASKIINMWPAQTYSAQTCGLLKPVLLLTLLIYVFLKGIAWSLVPGQIRTESLN